VRAFDIAEKKRMRLRVCCEKKYLKKVSKLCASYF